MKLIDPKLYAARWTEEHIRREETDGRNVARNARVHTATYQTLDGDRAKEPRSFFFKHYGGKNHFSHIVIVECHRSAWGDWKYILEHNPEAVRIGLTATPPRRNENGSRMLKISNISQVSL